MQMFFRIMLSVLFLFDLLSFIVDNDVKFLLVIEQTGVLAVI